MIHVTALLKCKAGHAGDVKTALIELVEASLKEDACLQYELYQDTANENQFYFHETWQDAAGLDTHTQQPHYQQLGEKIGAYLDGEPAIHQTVKVA